LEICTQNLRRRVFHRSMSDQLRRFHRWIPPTTNRNNVRRKLFAAFVLIAVSLHSWVTRKRNESRLLVLCAYPKYHIAKPLVCTILGARLVRTIAMLRFPDSFCYSFASIRKWMGTETLEIRRWMIWNKPTLPFDEASSHRVVH
jgi:hypothetical protein